MRNVMLMGRRSERRVLDRLLQTTRDGRSGVVVVRGAPGVGKTALVEHAVATASGFRVVRVAGVASERDLAFAALQQLCRPALDALERLPEPQRVALGSALGLSRGLAPDRFLVGLAALGLLSALAAQRPLLCVVDDAQWLDAPSAQALGFVARRLPRAPIALMFATRARGPELAGLPELPVEALDDHDARALLAAAVTGPLDEHVGDRIVAETGGNPLALLDLLAGMTSARLAVGLGAPPAGRPEEDMRDRVDELPAGARRLLLVAAADQTGEPATLWRAARSLGVDVAAAGRAGAAGVFDVGASVRFRDPLLRSAIYASAAPDERRAVHRALAAATDAAVDPDRRAWQLAAAAAGPDEDAAAALERSAGRAQERGGLGAAAASLERAAELTPDPRRQAARLVAAARAHLGAGAIERAERLLRRGLAHVVDPVQRAEALRLEGAIRFAGGRGGDAASLLLDAALALADRDADAARAALLESLEAAWWAGGPTGGTTMADVAAAARALPGQPDPGSAASLLLTGYAQRIASGYGMAVPGWRAAARARAHEAGGRRRAAEHALAWIAAGELFDVDDHVAIARERVALDRAQGALATLPAALSRLAWCELLSGHVAAAEALAGEAGEIAATTGAPPLPGGRGIMDLALLAWRGDDVEAARRAADAVAAEAVGRGQGLGVVVAQFCLMRLELGHGRYEAARLHALRVFEDDPLYLGSINLADVVEATVRVGDLATARTALARLTQRARASGMPWGLGLLARARALLAADADAEAHHREAIDQLARAGVVVDLGRAHLLYGEWLRRRRRRRDARAQLQRARELLLAGGAAAFAERAAAELLATSEHARPRGDDTRDELTPRERRVAQLAAGGQSNAEIAGRLLISPNTVAYHLRKVFVKLQISSRRQLAGDAGERLAARC